jgi:hypothetical protein
MIYNHPTCFVNKDCYKKWGVFDTNLKIAMDYELLLRFHVQKVKFFYIQEVIANMTYGGRCDVHAIRGWIEVLKVLTAYGYSRYKGFLWLLVKILKFFVRKMFGNQNLLVQTYRKLRKKGEVK